MMAIAHPTRLQNAAWIGACLSLAMALPSSATGSEAPAKDWKTVRIGTDATYAPFETVDRSGALVGWEIDYGRALCAQMKVTCTFQDQDWDGIIPALLGGKFDVILSGMSITPKREMLVLFSTPYYQSQPVFIGQTAEKNGDVSPAALKGKSIGTQSSSIFADYLSRYYKDSDIKLYPAGDEANLELATGRLDYVMNDNVAAEHFIENGANGCCRIIATVKRDPDIFGTGVGAAFRKDDAELCRMFNEAIASLFANGTYDKLARRYFNIDVRPKDDP
jgi:polar amino acid transport system substrate-binding protein